MSSTWFKSVSALKVNFTYREGGYPYTNYILIVETAESNCYNSNGGHDYHKWIYAEGEYDEVMRKVFQGAIDFDNGMAKWKPNYKDSVGFIRMVKKALDNAVEVQEDSKLPYYLNGYVFWGTSNTYRALIDVFANMEGIEKKLHYGTEVLIANNVKSYIVNKRKINNMIKNYEESLVSRESFEDWLDYNKDMYFIQVESKKGEK